MISAKLLINIKKVKDTMSDLFTYKKFGVSNGLFAEEFYMLFEGDMQVGPPIRSVQMAEFLAGWCNQAVQDLKMRQNDGEDV